MFASGEAHDSPRPVMTFRVAGEWIAVAVDQMDRIAVATELHPVPLAREEHLGLMQEANGLMPVLRLGSQQPPSTEQLVAVLQVRGEPVGLAIEATGHVHHTYRVLEAEQAPAAFAAAGARAVQTPEKEYWLIDPDRLWQKPAAAPNPSSAV